ncbi:MAG TPA: porin [Steroidobacteraceae bacterium]|jgi:predicted porin/ribosomal protein L12E/L44/L45/RPP1/RPP2
MLIGTRALSAALAAMVVLATVPATSRAADNDAKLRTLQQQIEDLSKQIEELRKEAAEQAAVQAQATSQAQAAAQRAQAAAQQAQTVAGSAKAPKGAKEAPAETKFDKFIKGFYGTLDVSVDYTTKGINNGVAFPYDFANGPGSGYVVAGPQKGGPFGKVGWLGAMSSNGSNFGYRGSHPIPGSTVNFIYQVSTAIDMAAAPGLRNSWTKSSNTVQGAIGLGDTWLGFQDHNLGRIRFGEMYTPYKTSTDRLNPFAGGLGNYSVMLGNTGGDNRVEFGTRMDHVVSYASPTWSGLSFEAAYAFGQNIDPNNNLTPLGSPDCSGSNALGSGNLPLNCDDGGFDDAYSADIKFEQKNLYLVAAYEMHKRVNRSSDGIGANQPLVGLWDAQGPNGPNAKYLNWADFEAFSAEFPNSAPAGTPEYSTDFDVADEWAMKFGGQYTFDFGLSVSYLWEAMHRDLAQVFEFQNERTRNSDWLALQQKFNDGRDIVAIGWAHAGATPGDPGGQHNFDPQKLGNNQANMYTAQYWHKFDKQLTWYFDVAETVNDGNSHFDIGAGGHGIKTDCHDATHFTFVDYSSAGPTTWGGCHEIGLSTGINYKF